MAGKRSFSTASGITSPKSRKKTKMTKSQAVTALLKNRKKLRAVANQRIGGFLGIELKFVDSGRDQLTFAAPTDSTGGEYDDTTMLCLNGIAQGDAQNQRDGREVRIKSIFVHFNVFMGAQINQTAGDVPPIVFLAIVQDTQTNKAQMNSEDCFTNPIASAFGAPLCFRQLENSKRFKVMWSKRLQFKAPPLAWDGTNLEQSGQSLYETADITGLNIPVNYSGTGATVAAVTDNSFHIIGFASSTLCQMTWNSRIRFVG